MPIPTAIVVPLDGSEFAERALMVAGALGEQLGADLVLVSAPEEDRDAARDYLNQVSNEARAPILETIVADDLAPADAIVDAVRHGPNRVVCMTTHGRGRFRWAMIGSVAEDVVSRSAIPVVLAGPRCRTEPVGSLARIVVCVDGSPASEAVIPHACEWARGLDLEITLAFVIHPLDVEDAVHPDAVFGPLVDRIATQGLTANPVLLRSSYPAGELVDLAESSTVSMLAMTTHTRTGLARVVLGSVTMGVLNSAPCPVLVARPLESSGAGS